MTIRWILLLIHPDGWTVLGFWFVSFVFCPIALLLGVLPAFSRYIKEKSNTHWRSFLLSTAAFLLIAVESLVLYLLPMPGGS